MRDITGYPDTTVRGAIKALDIDVAVITSPGDLQPLRRAGFIQSNTAQVSVIVINKAVQLLNHYQVPEETVDAVRAIRSAPPPLQGSPGSRPASVQASPALSGHRSARVSASPAPSGLSPYPPSPVIPTPQQPRAPYQDVRTPPGLSLNALRWGTSPRPKQYVFPATMPRTVLTSYQETELYGLEKTRMPARLQDEVRAFKQWSQEPINTQRTNTYATASSSATLEKVGACIRAYLGYVSKYYHVLATYLELAEYQDPDRIMNFVAYLNARKAHKGHILNHLSIAKKINVYLASGLQEGTPERTHAHAMDSWLGTLIHQYNLSERNPVKANYPEATAMWMWCDRLSDLALFSTELDLQESGQMGPVSAQFAQDALVASLVTGREVSPFRLDFLKTVRHPRHNDTAPCSDRDCRDPLNCIGNRVELRAPRTQVSAFRVVLS